MFPSAANIINRKTKESFLKTTNKWHDNVCFRKPLSKFCKIATFGKNIIWK